MNYKPGEITIFIVPDTGVKLPVRKVAAGLIEAVEKQLRLDMPAPQPPKQQVDYGNGPVWEENLAHPDYHAALDEWKGKFNQELTARTKKLLLKRGVLPYLSLTHEQEEQIAELRAEMLEDYGVTLESDDKWVFVNHIALGTVEDLTDLVNAVIRRSVVTEEATQEAISKF